MSGTGPRGRTTDRPGRPLHNGYVAPWPWRRGRPAGSPLGYAINQPSRLVPSSRIEDDPYRPMLSDSEGRSRVRRTNEEGGHVSAANFLGSSQWSSSLAPPPPRTHHLPRLLSLTGWRLVCCRTTLILRAAAQTGNPAGTGRTALALPPLALPCFSFPPLPQNEALALALLMVWPGRARQISPALRYCLSCC